MNRFYINFEPKQTGADGPGIKQTDSNPLYMRQVRPDDSQSAAPKDGYSENNSDESQNADADENKTENDQRGYDVYNDNSETRGDNYPGVQNGAETFKEPDTYPGGSMTFGGKYQKPDNIIVSDRDSVYEPPQTDMGNKNNTEQSENNNTALTEDGYGSTDGANGAGSSGEDDSGANPGLNPPFDLFGFPGIGKITDTGKRPSSGGDEGIGAGSMIVQVFLAKQAIPLEGAKVLIESSSDNPDNIPPERYELYTDDSGRTPEVMLWAPSALISQSSGSTAVPYASYDISVSKEGYYNVYFKNATVFDGIVSIQNVEALPLGENGSHNAMVEEDNVFDETNEDIL